MELYELSVTSAANGVKAGDFSCEELVRSCLTRIEEKEKDVLAWENLNPGFALEEARKRDRSEIKGYLHGVPVGVKDIIDTVDFPTSYGSPMFKSHVPEKNAICINRLTNAGAIILGKTVSTEFAYLNPGKTRNPHKPEHTPGGSSSGSAAAVADFHVPCALGTQTAGSIIRPASFCGVTGYKPGIHSYPIDGIHPFAPSFDTLGSFTRSVTDLLMLHNVLSGKEIISRSVKPAHIALIKSPVWHQAQPETVAMMTSLEKQLRSASLHVDEPELDSVFDHIHEAHVSVMLYECTRSLHKIYERDSTQLSAKLKADFEKGLQITAEQVEESRQCIQKCKVKIGEVLSPYDLILTPSAPGYAPEGLETTGDPVFNRMWTALTLPCISLPVPGKDKTLPLGVQLIGKQYEDAELLNHALWLESFLNTQSVSI